MIFIPRKIVVCVGLLFLIATACRKTHMNLISAQTGAVIHYIHFDEQSEDAIFEGDTIYIPVTREAYLNGFKLQLDSLIISSFAEVDKQVGQVLSFAQPIRFRLIAENGLRHTYTVMATYTKGKGNTIQNFLLEGQVGRANIKNDTIHVNVKRIFFLTGLDLTLKRAILSKNATLTPAQGNTANYRDPLRYRVTSENGEQKYYTVVVDTVPEEKPTIPNSDFETWYHQDPYSTAYITYHPYDNLGKDGSDITRWASYNDGMAQVNYEFSLAKTEGFRGLDNRSQNGTAALLTTQNLRSITAGLAYRGIVPGIVFTGAIVNITNEALNSNLIKETFTQLGIKILNFFKGEKNQTPSESGGSGVGNKILTPPSPTEFRNNSLYGILFSGHPTSISFDYKYIPTSSDQMDAFVILENRSLDGSTVKRLGVAWLRGGKQDSWKNVNLPVFWAVKNNPPKPYYPFLESKVPEAALDQNYLLPNQPKWTWGDSRKDDVTHIVVVFTSSYEGVNQLKGEVGSKLYIDNFKLNYDLSYNFNYIKGK